MFIRLRFALVFATLGLVLAAAASYQMAYANVYEGHNPLHPMWAWWVFLPSHVLRIPFLELFDPVYARGSLWLSLGSYLFFGSFQFWVLGFLLDMFRKRIAS